MPTLKKVKAPYQREREKNFSISLSCRALQTVFKNGVTTYPYDILTYGVKADRGWMRDFVTPGYAQRVSDGQVCNSPMSSMWTRHYGDDGGLKTLTTFSPTDYYTWELSRVVGVKHPYPTCSTLVSNVDALKTEAQTRAAAQMNSAGFQGLVFLAELHKTYELLRHPLASVSDILQWISQQRRARRDIVVKRTRNSRTINGRTYPCGKNEPGGSVVIPFGASFSSAHLAYTFGLQPLMMDIDALLHKIPRLHEQDRYTARSQVTDSSSKITTGSCTPGGLCKVDYSDKITTEVVVRAGLLYSDNFSIPQDFGMDFASLPEAAWELLPWSFLIDYFVNIGDLLGACRMLQCRNVLAPYITTIICNKVERTYGKHTTAYSQITVLRPLTGTYFSEETVRSRETSLSHIGLAIKGSPLTPAHVANMLALITQQLVGLGKPTLR